MGSSQPAHLTGFLSPLTSVNRFAQQLLHFLSPGISPTWIIAHQVLQLFLSFKWYPYSLVFWQFKPITNMSTKGNKKKKNGAFPVTKAWASPTGTGTGTGSVPLVPYGFLMLHLMTHKPLCLKQQVSIWYTLYDKRIHSQVSSSTLLIMCMYFTNH